MPRPEKVQAVEEIKERFGNAEAVFLTEYRGLSVKQQQVLRRALRASGADYKVLKMSLTAIAARDLGYDEVADDLVGPTAIAFANEDPVATAKALDEFAGENEAFVLKLGLLSGELLAPEQIAALAKLPSRDELLAKIAGAVKAPLTAAAGMFSSFTRNSASMFSQLLDKKEAGDPIAGAGGPTAADEAPSEEPAAEVEEAPEAEEATEAPAEDETAEEAPEAADTAEAEEAGTEDEADAPPEGEPTAEATDDSAEADPDEEPAEAKSEEDDVKAEDTSDAEEAEASDDEDSEEE